MHYSRFGYHTACGKHNIGFVGTTWLTRTLSLVTCKTCRQVMKGKVPS